MTDLHLLAAAIVAIASTGRLTRLWVDDDWPPLAAVRRWYLSRASEAWAPLATCAFCTAPWFALGVLTWAWVSHLHWTWWAFNAWLALGYAAALLVVRDTPE